MTDTVPEPTDDFVALRDDNDQLLSMVRQLVAVGAAMLVIAPTEEKAADAMRYLDVALNALERAVAFSELSQVRFLLAEAKAIQHVPGQDPLGDLAEAFAGRVEKLKVALEEQMDALKALADGDLAAARADAES